MLQEGVLLRYFDLNKYYCNSYRILTLPNLNIGDFSRLFAGD